MTDAAGEASPELAWFHAIAEGGARSRGAIAELYHAYEAPFLKFLRPMGEETARDLLHDCFEKILRGARHLRLVRRPRAYLWSMLRHAIADYRRTHASRMSAYAEMVGSVKEGELRDASPFSQLEFTECIDRAFSRFASRHPHKAFAVRMAAREEMSAAEIAVALGKNPGGAREFLSQARREFRDLTRLLGGECRHSRNGPAERIPQSHN